MVAVISDEAGLRDALCVGGEIHVNTSDEIGLSSSLEIVKPTVLIGGRFTVDKGPAIHITSSWVDIHRTKITGGSDPYDKSQKLIHAEGTGNDPLCGITIRDCHLHNSRGSNIWLDWCQQSIVSGNVIDRFLYAGVMVVSGRNITVDGNIISDAPLIDPVVNTYGIAITDIDNTEDARSQDCTIVGNRVDLIDWEAIDTHGGRRITITGNTVTASPRGIALVAGNETRIGVPQECVVSGNTVDGSGARRSVRSGISVFGTSSNYADAVITGNSVTGYDTSVWTSNVDREKTLISGNTVPWVGWTPIVLDGDFIANTTHPPELCVDGRVVWMRGGVIPTSSGRDFIGHVPSEYARPGHLTFLGYTHGSNPGAGGGMVGVWPDGKIQLFYHTGSDHYTYFLFGSYRV